MFESISKDLYLVLLSEQCSRYTDMKTFLQNIIISKSVDLSKQERDLLFISYKNIITKVREAVHTLTSYQIKEESKSEESPYLSYIKEYKEKIKKELKEICEEFTENIEKNLITRAETNEAKCFYYKLKGDYYRYVAENLDGEEKNKYVEKSKENYEKSIESGNKLESLNQVKIGLMLNYSVFLYEVGGNKEKGIKIAQETYDKGKEEIEKIKEKDNEEIKEVEKIIDLIEENLNGWKEDDIDEN